MKIVAIGDITAAGRTYDRLLRRGLRSLERYKYVISEIGDRKTKSI